MSKPLPKQKDLPKKERKKSQSQLRKELDRIFSLYIRHKYAKNGQVQCYTCPNIRPIAGIQNGHFVSRLYLATRYSEDNCRPQCVGCNVYGKGKTATFGANLERDCGAETVSHLFREAQTIFKDFPYAEKIKEYKEKLAHLSTT